MRSKCAVALKIGPKNLMNGGGPNFCGTTLWEFNDALYIVNSGLFIGRGSKAASHL